MTSGDSPPAAMGVAGFFSKLDSPGLLGMLSKEGFWNTPILKATNRKPATGIGKILQEIRETLFGGNSSGGFAGVSALEGAGVQSYDLGTGHHSGGGFEVDHAPSLDTGFRPSFTPSFEGMPDMTPSFSM